jgi:hypothetical protein
LIGFKLCDNLIEGADMAKRNNASFTGSPLSGHGSGSRTLVEAFYAVINEEIPGSTPVPIPHPESVHPKHDEETQIFIFADYVVRKIAPIALDAAGLKTYATELRDLPEIVDGATAAHAERAAAYAAEHADIAAGDAAYFGDATVARRRLDADRAVSDAAHGAVIVAIRVAAHAFHHNYTVIPIASPAARSACAAAKLNPDETWAAVTEMLAALCGTRPNSSSKSEDLALARKIGDAAPYLLEDKDSVSGYLDRRRMDNHVEVEYFNRLKRAPTKAELNTAFDAAQARSHNFHYRLRQSR